MDNYSILSKAIGDTFEPQLDEFIDSVNLMLMSNSQKSLNVKWISLYGEEINRILI